MQLSNFLYYKQLSLSMLNKKICSLRCGCFIRDINAGKTKNDGLPLKSSEYEVQIANTIANITLIQTYINPTNKYLEVQYDFPINPNSCVYRFIATFGNKRIEGIVKEKEEAKKEYKQAIKNGKQAALGQLDSERNDILNLQVGNIGPNETVKIQITYLQELSLCYNMFYEFHMSGTISPMYMNQIPKDVIKKAYRNEAAKLKGDYYWNFRIILKTSRKVNFFDSKTHDIKLVSQNDTQTQSVFMMTAACIPNKDFTFTYTTEDYQLPCYVLGRTDLSSTALISFVPKFCDLSIDDAYKASVNGTPNEIDIQNAKGQYYFLLDRSGSMEGSRMEKAKESLILFIKSLPQDVYFNVISFGSGYRTLFPASVKYDDVQIKKAIKEIKSMKADMGGTQIYAPLESILTAKPIDGYPKQIFLLTDGAVSSPQHVFDVIQVNNKYSRVHTIGIGNGASQDLIIGCAQKGKGYHTFITDQENPNSKIIQLLTDSLSPVISKMKLIYDKNVIHSIIPNPQSLPYVLKGEIVNFYVNFKGQLDQKTKISFSYQDSLNKLPYASELQIDPQSTNQSFIDRMGYFKKIRILQSSLKHNSVLEDLMYYVKFIDKKVQIIDLSIKSQILSRQTAFFSVEKELIDGKYEQIKSVGQVKIEIQSVQPIQIEKGGMGFGMQTSIKRYSMKSKSNSQNLLMKKKGVPSSALAVNSIRSSNVAQKPQARKQQKKQRSYMIEQDEQCEMKQLCDSYQIPEIKKQMPKKQAEVQNNDDRVLRGRRKQNKIQTDTKQLAKLESTKSNKKINISEIISFQISDGSWNDVKVIESILGVENIIKIPRQEMTPVVITFLVVKWIEKYYPQKQYSLVVKKGLNFIKRAGGQIDKLTNYCSIMTI